MDKAAENTVFRQVHIDARPETIFQFLIDPEKLIRWKGVRAELDPRPGGLYRVEITPGSVVEGKYLEITPYTRVVFTWGWSGENSPLPPGSSTVEISLAEDGAGTLLSLRHFDLPESQRASHAEGWEHYLPRLAALGAGRDPGPDPWAQGS